MTVSYYNPKRRGLGNLLITFGVLRLCLESCLLYVIAQDLNLRGKIKRVLLIL